MQTLFANHRRWESGQCPQRDGGSTCRPKVYTHPSCNFCMRQNKVSAGLSGLKNLLPNNFIKRTFKKKMFFKVFPGGAVVENLPANAGDTGSGPGLGRSHMPRSNWAHEPQLLSLHVWSLRSATKKEAAIVRGPHTTMKSGPRSPQLEKALAQKRRANTAKNK